MTPPLAPRQRAPTTRVRTGCSTCKGRHVKCDERTPPPCARCAKLGLPCEYAPPPVETRGRPRKAKLTAVTSVSPVVTAQPLCPARHRVPCSFLSAEESFFAGLYVHRMAGRLAGGEFWAPAVPRECGRDEAVRLGVVAVGAMAHAVHLRRGWPRARGRRRHGEEEGRAVVYEVAARRFYGRALACLRARMVVGEKDPRSILMATLVFVLYELIQGHHANADGLMVNGLLVLGDRLTVYQQDESHQRVPARLDDGGVRDGEFLLARMASHNHLGSRFRTAELHEFSCRTLALGIRTDVPDEDCPVDRVLEIWDATMSRVFLWINRVGSWRERLEERPALKAGVAAVFDERTQARWRAVLGRKMAETACEQRRGVLAVVLAGLRLSNMLMACLGSPSEMVWDDFEADCREALRLLEQSMGSSSSSSPGSLTGLVLDDKALFLARLITHKCRRKGLRRRALAVLRRFLVDDAAAVLDVEAQVMAAEVLVAAEEEGRDGRGVIPSEWRYGSVAWEWKSGGGSMLRVTLEGTARDSKVVDVSMEDLGIGS